MAARDAQDILDVKQADLGRPKKKSQKPKLVRPAHIPKEVWLLETQGDRAPPVALTAVQPKKPKFTRKVRPWEWQPFTHPNRTDGLVLRHWRKKNMAAGAEAQSNGPATPAEGVPADIEQVQPVKTEPQPDMHWTKYNVKVDVPKYTDEEYSTRLQSDEWSKEETDYLMKLAEDFDLRWVVIADRYEFHPTSSNISDDNAMAVTAAVKPRTMEDMKARYYRIAAAMMDTRMGMANMTPAEFNLHEKMIKYDPAKEAKRKRMAEQLLQRTEEEIEEERRLLVELKRIIQEEDDFIRERTELYERLNAPASRQSVSQFESSQGLMQLMQSLLQQEKARSKNAAMNQRRSIAGMEDLKDKTNTPITPGPQSARGGDARKSLDSTAGGDRRKDSKAGHAHTPSFVQRHLSAREEQKYGVQRPEKLLTGEKIRHLRIEKRVTARASSVAAKVQDSMVELGIPIKPVMATSRIVAGYEELCSNLDMLLDYRRHSEKTENEIKVLKAQKDMREGKEKGNDDNNNKTSEEAGDKTKSGEEKNEARSAEEEAEVDNAPKEKRDEDEADEQKEDEQDDEAVRAQSDDGDNDEDDEEEEDGANEDETPAEPADDDDDADEDADADGDADADADADGDGETEGEESRPSTRASGRSNGRKRSVSVLSSAPSQKSSKRPRK